MTERQADYRHELITEVILAAEGAVSPFALSAHVDPPAVGEHGAPRLPVARVLQRAAVVLPAIVYEGKDARCSAGSAGDCCAFLAKGEGENTISGTFFANYCAK